jgi:hypothetical protein
MDSRAPENPAEKQLEELPPCWLELSGCRPRIAFLPLLLLMEKQGGGQGTFAASAAADRRSWRGRTSGSPDWVAGRWRLELT